LLPLFFHDCSPRLVCGAASAAIARAAIARTPVNAHHKCLFPWRLRRAIRIRYGVVNACAAHGTFRDMICIFQKVVLVERRVEMTRNEGRLLGFLCQQAFIILATMEGDPLGIGRRRPSFT
jgi:hypothetical protein